MQGGNVFVQGERKACAVQTGETWNTVMHAKAKGARNLDKASRRLKDLDYFVMWSSFVASAGNEGELPCCLTGDHNLPSIVDTSIDWPC